MPAYSDDVLNLLKQFISNDYLTGSDLYIKNNKGNIDSICVSSVATAYRRAVKDVLLLRVKSSGSKPYIGFRAKYSKQLNELGIGTYKTAAENDFVRVLISDFMSLDFADSNISVQLTALFNKIFADSMSFDSFGCCSKYIDCSNADKCLHEDQLYSTACMYRKNLEAGRNFYATETHNEVVNIPKIAVIDVETPNRNNDAICSIGIVTIEDNKIKNKEYYLVNPETYFDEYNIKIHNLTENDVVDSPTFEKVWENIKGYLSGYLLAGHNFSFDLSCIKKAMNKYGIKAHPAYYVDTMSISRKFVCNVDSYGLDALCNHFNIDLINHHNALDDSVAAAELLINLVSSYKIDLDDFTRQYEFDYSGNEQRVKSNFNCETKFLQELQGVLFGVTCDGILTDNEILATQKWMNTHKELKGNFPYDKIYGVVARVLEDGIITEEERQELFNLFNIVLNPVKECVLLKNDIIVSGAKLCLTGDFVCMSKSELGNRLVTMGAVVTNSVTKDLAYLVVGDKGSERWSQGSYGNKVKKALELNEKGCNIVIIKETDFITSVLDE